MLSHICQLLRLDAFELNVKYCNSLHGCSVLVDIGLLRASLVRTVQ